MITAHDLSLAYVQAVSAYWRGESDLLPTFDAWLAQFWVDGPAEPTTLPREHLPHGAAGRGIRWHECGSLLYGYVPGMRGCLRVPRAALLPREADRRKLSSIAA